MWGYFCWSLMSTIKEPYMESLACMLTMESVVETNFFINSCSNFPKVFPSEASKVENSHSLVFNLSNCQIRAFEPHNLNIFIELWPLMLENHGEKHPTVPSPKVRNPNLRALVGSLQYAVTHTRPDLAAKLGEVQANMAHPKVSTMLLCNKVLREAQENSQVQICFRSIPVEKVTHVSFGDASFASAKQLSSFQGSLICATTEEFKCQQRSPYFSSQLVFKENIPCCSIHALR